MSNTKRIKGLTFDVPGQDLIDTIDTTVSDMRQNLRALEMKIETAEQLAKLEGTHPLNRNDPESLRQQHTVMMRVIEQTVRMGSYVDAAATYVLTPDDFVSLGNALTGGRLGRLLGMDCC